MTIMKNLLSKSAKAYILGEAVRYLIGSGVDPILSQEKYRAISPEMLPIVTEVWNKGQEHIHAVAGNDTIYGKKWSTVDKPDGNTRTIKFELLTIPKSVAGGGIVWKVIMPDDKPDVYSRSGFSHSTDIVISEIFNKQDSSKIDGVPEEILEREATTIPTGDGGFSVSIRDTPLELDPQEIRKWEDIYISTMKRISGKIYKRLPRRSKKSTKHK